MGRVLLTLFAFSGCFLPEARADFDVSVGSGYVSLEIKETVPPEQSEIAEAKAQNQPAPEDKKYTVKVNGQTYNLWTYIGVFQRFSVFGGGQFTAVYLEKNRSHLARYSPLMGGSLHLLGGARRLEFGGDQVKVTRSHTYALSLIGMTQADFVGTRSDAHEFKSGVANVRGGFELLIDLNDRHAVSLVSLATLVALPIGSKYVEEEDKELALAWRIWL